MQIVLITRRGCCCCCCCSFPATCLRNIWTECVCVYVRYKLQGQKDNNINYAANVQNKHTLRCLSTWNANVKMRRFSSLWQTVSISKCDNPVAVHVSPLQPCLHHVTSGYICTSFTKFTTLHTRGQRGVCVLCNVYAALPMCHMCVCVCVTRALPAACKASVFII